MSIKAVAVRVTRVRTDQATIYVQLNESGSEDVKDIAADLAMMRDASHRRRRRQKVWRRT